MAEQFTISKACSNPSDNEVKEDKSRKKGRVWVYSALILATLAAKYTPTIPLDVDNGLPGVELGFGTKEDDEICFVCI